MELWRIAIPVARGDDTRRLLALLRDLRVPMNPCAGEPRFESDNAGRRQLLVIVTARVQEQLRTAGRAFEVVRDLADVPDPRIYVSRTNRFAAELARLRAAKTKR
jgi:hypothetical protein